MAPRILVLLVTYLLIVFLAINAEKVSSTVPYYTAAVFEHNTFATLGDTPRTVIQTNLDFYRRATETAATLEADIIVFPEYGLYPAREKVFMKEYFENIPDPKKLSCNPCKEQKAYSDRPILRQLSCLAMDNSIVLVANMGDIQSCEGDPDCDEDGVFQFNTNVVFDKDGKLILKYHKEHLFYEYEMDVPKEQQVPIFQTEFGNFATFISFDIDFKRMAEVAQWPSIDAIVFTSVWIDLAPLKNSAQFWQSWALGNNCTLLATNLHIPGYFSIGSGIFHGQKGALAYSYNPDSESKLVLARVPKRGYPISPPKPITMAIRHNDSWHWKHDDQIMKMECSLQLLNDSQDTMYDYRCVDQNIEDYTFSKLTNRSGHIEACSNSMCCSVDYTTKKLSENFYLGVFNGTLNLEDRYFLCEEICMLVRCETAGKNLCSTFPRISKTVFHQVQLKANFTTKHVYPSFLESGMKLVPKNEWKYEVTPLLEGYETKVNFKSQEGRNLITVALNGRCYDKDTPYKRVRP